MVRFRKDADNGSGLDRQLHVAPGAGSPDPVQQEIDALMNAR